MSFNITLLGQMITFILFVWFTKRMVWPFVMAAMKERQETIADGLAAAERGKRELELAQHKSAEMMRDAKIQAAEIIEQANKRSQHMIEQAKEDARTEGQRLVDAARGDIARERETARESLRQEIAGIAVASASKILGTHIDEAANNGIVDQFLSEVSGE